MGILQLKQSHWISGFTISLPYTIADGDSNKVKVFVYDKYLNCSVLSLANPSNEIQNTEMQLLNVYPNPATDLINFELQDRLVKNSTISIYSADGKIVFSKKLNDSERLQLEISEFAAGVYLLKIHSKDTIYQGRFNKI